VWLLLTLLLAPIVNCQLDEEDEIEVKDAEDAGQDDEDDEDEGDDINAGAGAADNWGIVLKKQVYCWVNLVVLRRFEIWGR
jgi:hypothetical protein